jgi:hypothetical protein
VLRRPARPLHGGVLAELRRDHHLAAPVAERLADEPLAVAVAVDVGRVEEGDTGVEGGLDDGRGRAPVEPPTEVVAAEPDHRDLEIGAAEPPRLHDSIVRAASQRRRRARSST